MDNLQSMDICADHICRLCAKNHEQMIYIYDSDDNTAQNLESKIKKFLPFIDVS